jgi:hypothetical protein
MQQMPTATAAPQGSWDKACIKQQVLLLLLLLLQLLRLASSTLVAVLARVHMHS